jgi:hypothetical protein
MAKMVLTVRTGKTDRTERKGLLEREDHKAYKANVANKVPKGTLVQTVHRD